MSMSEDELFASPVSTYKILVLCVGNTCRSIMYHSILKEQNRPNIEVFSAGFKTKENSISDFTNRILTEMNVPVAKTLPSHIDMIDTNLFYDEVVILDYKYNKDNLNDLRYKKIISFDVFDPAGDDYQTYKETFREIDSILKNGF